MNIFFSISASIKRLPSLQPLRADEAQKHVVSLEHLPSVVILVLTKAFAYAGFQKRIGPSDHPIGGGMHHLDTRLPCALLVVRISHLHLCPFVVHR